jgi:predicted DNA repair protein MutK
MDDVVVMSKIATKKQRDIRDDLAVNAEKASDLFPLETCFVGYNERLFLNKLIILPLFFVSYFVPWLITVVLILGLSSLLKVLKKYTSISFLTNKRLPSKEEVLTLEKEK